MTKTMKLEMRMGNEERNGGGRKEKQKILPEILWEYRLA